MTEPLTPDPMNAHEKVERLIGKVLSEQPLRSAPRTLESRVLAEIEKRAALPWWRNSFLHWPLPVRCAFLLLSLGVVKAVLMSIHWAITDSRTAPVVSAITRPLSWAEEIARFCGTMMELVSVVSRAVPPHWLYIGLLGAAALYVALFVLGATAYRTLYVNK